MGVALFPRRLRVLSEPECEARLYGARSLSVLVLGSRSDALPAAEAPPSRAPAAQAPLGSPSATHPAPDLVFRYPRQGARISGEEVRIALLRRMQARDAA